MARAAHEQAQAVRARRAHARSSPHHRRGPALMQPAPLVRMHACTARRAMAARAFELRQAERGGGRASKRVSRPSVSCSTCSERTCSKRRGPRQRRGATRACAVHGTAQQQAGRAEEGQGVDTQEGGREGERSMIQAGLGTTQGQPCAQHWTGRLLHTTAAPGSKAPPAACASRASPTAVHRGLRLRRQEGGWIPAPRCAAAACHPPVAPASATMASAVA